MAQVLPDNFTPSSGFGPHLMLDCRSCSLEKISDQKYVYDVLDSLPTAIGMTKIVPPYVFPYSGLIPEDQGITGTVIIAESHLTFHSFIEKDYFFFDIFSCKPFLVDPVIDYVLKAFDVQDHEMHLVHRGRFFPRSQATSVDKVATFDLQSAAHLLERSFSASSTC